MIFVQKTQFASWFALDSVTNQQNGAAKACGRLEQMETVWGALLSFLFVVAIALYGHGGPTLSKEQIEQIEKAEKEQKEQLEKAEKEQKEKAEQGKKSKQDASSKQKGKAKQSEPEVWRLRQ